MGAKAVSTREMLSAVSVEGFTDEWHLAPLHRSMVRGAISAVDYQNSPFERWNLAVQAHRKAFADLMHRKGIRIA